jgi:hypothetical protein
MSCKAVWTASQIPKFRGEHTAFIFRADVGTEDEDSKFLLNVGISPKRPHCVATEDGGSKFLRNVCISPKRPHCIGTEDGASMFIWNVGINLQVHMALQPRSTWTVLDNSLLARECSSDPRRILRYGEGKQHRNEGKPPSVCDTKNV